MQTESAATKNIVICSDGTGNQFGKCNSNVVKVYTSLAIGTQSNGRVTVKPELTDGKLTSRYWSAKETEQASIRLIYETVATSVLFNCLEATPQCGETDSDPAKSATGVKGFPTI